MKEFLKKLEMDKIKINWNKKPIKMELFLSFLTVETEKQSEFLGSSTGWTKYTGDNGLDIKGGIVGGTEYLDRILYGKNLDNPYNNFVNPFYIFDILNDDGKKFFLDYYAEDIQDILKSVENQAVVAKNIRDKTLEFWVRYGVTVR